MYVPRNFRCRASTIYYHHDISRQIGTGNRASEFISPTLSNHSTVTFVSVRPCQVCDVPRHIARKEVYGPKSISIYAVDC